jgi:copper chaperone CopZ
MRTTVPGAVEAHGSRDLWTSDAGNVQTDSFFVTGMQCGGCTIKLSLALRGLSGVDDVQISLASGAVSVVYDPVLVSPLKIREAVIGTGFGTGGIAATNGHDPRPDQCG